MIIHERSEQDYILNILEDGYWSLIVHNSHHNRISIDLQSAYHLIRSPLKFANNVLIPECGCTLDRTGNDYYCTSTPYYIGCAFNLDAICKDCIELINHTYRNHKYWPVDISIDISRNTIDDLFYIINKVPI